MARSALRASEDPERIEARAALLRSSERTAFKEKKFKSLTAKEKDQLLKELAIRAGLLDDDGED
mgnify:CR=1 FL=1